LLARPVLLAALATAAGCGDDLRPVADGGSELSSLSVMDPPGESIGLPFHGTAELRVAYLDPEGNPIEGGLVTFELVTSASEASGGSTLSASQAGTDADGAAGVELVAGAERVNFRVQASAASAPPALFYIAVSEGGFADLTAVPDHVGFRADGLFGSVEVRLYRAAELGCAGLDIDEPPESVFPQRALPGFGESIDYRNVGAGEPYTLVAWAGEEADGARLAAGCAELGADQVRPGGAIRLPLPVADRVPAVSALTIESTFDASSLAGALAAAGPTVWDALDCPLGRAQLLLDCTLDAQAPDGALDCQVGGSSPLVDDAQARRGPLDAEGCRPETDGGQASLDAALEAELGPPWPAGAALAALLDARRAPLRSFRLTSRLEAEPGALGHRLDRIAVGSGADGALDLVASDRPVVHQVVPIALDLAGGRIALAEHRFTVDYGRFARVAFAELGLAPAGLTGRADDLGSALYESVAVGAQTGCTAFSGLVCGDLGRAAGCLGAACGAGRLQLDLLLDRDWLLLDGDGADLVLAGSISIEDADADLVLDQPSGSWTGQLLLSTGEPAPITGAFGGDPAPR
jgi:hypothetical protein